MCYYIHNESKTEQRAVVNVEIKWGFEICQAKGCYSV